MNATWLAKARLAGFGLAALLVGFAGWRLYLAFFDPLRPQPVTWQAPAMVGEPLGIDYNQPAILWFFDLSREEDWRVVPEVLAIAERYPHVQLHVRHLPPMDSDWAITLALHDLREREAGRFDQWDSLRERAQRKESAEMPDRRQLERIPQAHAAAQQLGIRGTPAFVVLHPSVPPVRVSRLSDLPKALSELPPREPPTARFWASLQRSPETIVRLLGDPPKEILRNRGLLEEAARIGRADLVRYLRRLGVPPEGRMGREEPLLFALAGGHEEAARALTEGRQPKLDLIREAADAAAAFRSPGCLSLLLDLGLDPNTTFSSTFLPRQTSEPEPWLPLGERGSMRLGMAGGMPGGIMRVRREYPLLHYAAASGSESAARLLLAKGADATRKVAGKSAADVARENGHGELAKLLERSG